MKSKKVPDTEGTMRTGTGPPSFTAPRNNTAGPLFMTIGSLKVRKPMADKRQYPTIIDNDVDEITAEMDGKEIRGWSYANQTEQGVKMRMAHEFAEGWFQAVKATPMADILIPWSDMEKEIDIYRKALTRLGRRGAGFGPAGHIARDALAKASGEKE
jgi:hypothetical protein